MKKFLKQISLWAFLGMISSEILLDHGPIKGYRSLISVVGCLVKKPSGGGVTFGRSVSKADEGNTSFTVGFSGGAAANGVWLYAVVASNDASFTISGSWTTVVNSGGVGIFKRLASSEPATYTVGHSGGTSKDSASVALIEVLGANATNPDASNTATNTGTCATITTSAIDGILLLIGDSSGAATNFTTPPSGYTLRENVADTGTPANSVSIAVKTGVAAGSISPGNWTPSSGPTSKSATVGLKV